MGIDDRLLIKVFWTVYDRVREGSIFVENLYSIHKNAYGSTWFLISPLFYCFLWEISNSFDLRPKPHFSILVWNLYKRGTVSWYDLSQILSEYSNQGYCYPQNNLSLFLLKWESVTEPPLPYLQQMLNISPAHNLHHGKCKVISPQILLGV